MSSAKLDNLYESEKDVVLEFFLNKMEPEVRTQLMATYPQHYALLFPGVSEPTIRTLVTNKMRDNSGAYLLPKHERKPL